MASIDDSVDTAVKSKRPAGMPKYVTYLAYNVLIRITDKLTIIHNSIVRLSLKMRKSSL